MLKEFDSVRSALSTSMRRSSKYLEATDLVASWNAICPVGGRVEITLDDGSLVWTTTAGPAYQGPLGEPLLPLTHENRTVSLHSARLRAYAASDEVGWVELTQRAYNHIRSALMKANVFEVRCCASDRAAGGGTTRARAEAGVRGGSGRALLRREDRLEGDRWVTRYWIHG